MHSLLYKQVISSKQHFSEFLCAVLLDFVDYSAPALWGITNKSSLLSDYSLRNVHAALQPFMMLVSANEKLFGALNDLNLAMSSVWDCAHENPTSCPGILKAKVPLLGRASNKNARGPAAAELLLSLWIQIFPTSKPCLKLNFCSFILGLLH